MKNMRELEQGSWWIGVCAAATSGAHLHWHEYGRAGFFALLTVLFGLAYLKDKE